MQHGLDRPVKVNEKEAKEQEEDEGEEEVAGNGLTVNLMKEDPKKKNKINSMLPQPPFLMTVVAQRASGKTNMCIDFLADNLKYGKHFDLIYIWSTSFYHDSKWKNIKLPCEEKMVREIYDMDEIEDLFKTLQEISKHTHMEVLFLFDDMIDQNVMQSHHMGTIEAIAVRGRHYNISIIMISQLYKKLSVAMRVNSTNLIFFRIRNRGELDKIVDENQESLTKDEFLQVYNHCTEEPYTFLHINNQEPDPSKRFRKNWDNIIHI